MKYSAWLSKYGWLLGMLIIVALPAIIVGDSYYIDVFNLAGIYAIVVIGLVLLTGYAGQVSLGHNGFYALGGYGTALATINFGLPWPVGLIIGVVTSMILAAAVGMAALRLRGDYLAIATLAFGVIIWSIPIAFPEFTGGSDGIRGVPDISFGGWVIKSDFQYYFVIWAVVIILFYLSRNIARSRIGRALKALHVDEQTAESLGINAASYKIKVFMISAVWASLAGSLFAHYNAGFMPAAIEVRVAVDYVIMLFLGGTANLWGALIGAAILKALPEFLEFFQNFKVVIYGFVLLLVLFFMPEGIAGRLESIFTRRNPKNDAHRGEVESSSKAQFEDITRISLRQRTEIQGILKVQQPILEVEGLTKSFGGVHAVNNLSYQVIPQEIKAIIGPNGAGKTTAFNLITGYYPVSSGTVRFKGEVISGRKSCEIAAMGISRTFQNLRLFNNMTVLENVMVGCHVRSRAQFLDVMVPRAWVKAEEDRIREEAIKCLEYVGLQSKAMYKPNNLAYGERKLLELARALASKPEVLCLDEPAAGLNETEKIELLELVSAIHQTGVTILLVEHDMNFIMNLADDIVVMNDGRKLAEGVPEEVRRNTEVIDAYLGPAV